MASLDLYILEWIIKIICSECSSPKVPHGSDCLEMECDSSCPIHEYPFGPDATLAALCRTSKRVNAIATRHLYHRLACERWELLLRTLLDRPDLALCVKHLCSRYWEMPLASDRTIEPPIPKDVRPYWDRQYSLDYVSDVRRNALPWGRVPRLAASLCPNPAAASGLFSR